MERSRDLHDETLAPPSGAPLDSHTPPAPTSSARHHRTNKPLPRIGRDARRRAHRDKYGNTKRWNGTAPTLSPQQQRELDDLRAFERARDCDELPARGRCIGGSSLVALRDAGSARPVDRVPASWCSNAGCRDRMDHLRVCSHGRYFRLRPELVALGLSRRQWAAIGWTLAAQFGYRGEWLLARHADMAELLDCCERTAGSVVRSLVTCGWLVRMPQYDTETVRVIANGKSRQYTCHMRGPSAYRVAQPVLDLLGIDGKGERGTPLATTPSKDYQATEKPDSNSSVSVILPGEQARPGGLGGVPASPSRSFFTQPDESHLLDSDADRVKTRAVTGRGSGRGESTNEATAPSASDPRRAAYWRRSFEKNLASAVKSVTRNERRAGRKARGQVSRTIAAARQVQALYKRLAGDVRPPDLPAPDELRMRAIEAGNVTPPAEDPSLEPPDERRMREIRERGRARALSVPAGFAAADAFEGVSSVREVSGGASRKVEREGGIVLGDREKKIVHSAIQDAECAVRIVLDEPLGEVDHPRSEVGFVCHGARVSPASDAGGEP